MSKASIPIRDTIEQSEENILKVNKQVDKKKASFQCVSNQSTTTSSGGCDSNFNKVIREEMNNKPSTIAKEFIMWEMQKQMQDMLVPLQAQPQVYVGPVAKPCNPSKDINMMTLTGDDSSLKTNQLRVLTNALDSEVREKASTFRTEFNLDSPDAPKTPGEFKQRIADGKFTFIRGNEPMKDDERMPYGYSEYLTFRDPDKLPDREGYDTALVNLRNTKEDYAVKISVLQNPEDGLKILEDFKALPTTSFH